MIKQRFTSKNFTIDVDFSKDYLSIAGIVREKFKTIVETKDVSSIKKVMEKYSLDEETFHSPNLEDYFVKQETGKIKIADETYAFPSYMFATINSLTSHSVLDVVRTHVKKQGVKFIKSLNEESVREQFVDFKSFYYRNMKKELPYHSDISKIEKVGSAYAATEFSSIDEYIDSIVHTGILISCIDFLKNEIQISL